MPLRHCVSCGREGDKDTFLRVVREPDGTFRIDDTGRMNGRGAYLCREQACLEKAVRKQGLNRSFRQAVPKEIYEQLGSHTGG
ncbi:MAG: YlxR family protein [Lachnospiraceae bacterium]|nr:YlxR family protein [Lachnospiraceae bacterium]